MNELPAPLPLTAGYVVRAVPILPLGFTVCWLEHLYLDGPEGCYLTPAKFAERWAGKMSAATIERYRSYACAWGLMVKVARPGARSFGYRPTLPPDCRPPAKIPPRSFETAILPLAARLTAHLRKVEPRFGADPNPHSAQTRTPIRAGPEPPFDSDPNPHSAQTRTPVRPSTRGASGGPTGGPVSQSSGVSHNSHSAQDLERVGSHEPKSERKAPRLASSSPAPIGGLVDAELARLKGGQ